MALTFSKKRQCKLSTLRLLALAAVTLVLLLASNAFAADNVPLTEEACTILEVDKIIGDSDAPLPKECNTYAADKIIRDSNRDSAAKQIGRYQISTGGFTADFPIVILDTVTGQVRLCEVFQPRTFEPNCLAWSKDDRLDNGK